MSPPKIFNYPKFGPGRESVALSDRASGRGEESGRALHHVVAPRRHNSRTFLATTPLVGRMQVQLCFYIVLSVVSVLLCSSQVSANLHDKVYSVSL